jgi:hypothetical protein
MNTSESSDFSGSDGLVIPYGLASVYFATDADGLWREECYCLLSQSSITQPVLQQVLAIGATLEKPLVVFATGISHKALVFSVINKLRGTALSAVIICPVAELKRIAAYLGADFPNIDSIRSPAELGSLPWIALTASTWGESIIERRTPPPKKRRNSNRSRRHG